MITTHAWRTGPLSHVLGWRRAGRAEEASPTRRRRALPHVLRLATGERISVAGLTRDRDVADLPPPRLLRIRGRAHRGTIHRRGVAAVAARRPGRPSHTVRGLVARHADRWARFQRRAAGPAG